MVLYEVDLKSGLPNGHYCGNDLWHIKIVDSLYMGVYSFCAHSGSKWREWDGWNFEDFENWMRKILEENDKSS